jgi:hypothetical protein
VRKLKPRPGAPTQGSKNELERKQGTGKIYTTQLSSALGLIRRKQAEAQIQNEK